MKAGVTSTAALLAHVPASAANKEFHWGFIDRSGEFVIPPTFEHLWPFSEGLAVAMKEGKYGYINHSGEWAIAPQFSESAEFHEGLAWVCIGENVGFVDHEGQIAIEPAFDHVDSFQHGLSAVVSKRMYGHVDTSGKYAIPPVFGVAERFSEGLAEVCKEDRVRWFIDRDGKTVLGPYIRVGRYSEGLAFAVTAERSGYIDHQGQWVIQIPGAAYGAQFQEGLASSNAPIPGDPPDSSGLYTCINRQGEIAHMTRSENFLWYRDGRAIYRKGGKEGVIDRRGNVIVEPIYDFIRPYTDGLAVVASNDRKGVIDQSGRVVIPLKFAALLSFSEGVAAAAVSE